MIAEAQRAAPFRPMMTILLVEQNVHGALRFARRAYIIKQGEIVAHGTGEGLLADPEMLKHYLGSK